MRSLFPALILASSAAAVAAAGESTGKEEKPRKETKAEKLGRLIMEANYKYMTTTQFASRAKLELIDRKGRVQTRHLRRLSETDGEDQERYVIVFDDPPDIRNTALLNIEHRDRDDDLWMYLPALKKTKRITGTNLRGSWVGTEFSYKDLKRERLSENRYVFVTAEKGAAAPVQDADGKEAGGAGEKDEKKEEAKRVDLLVVDAFPTTQREKDEQGYSRRRFWVRRDNYYGAKIEYYDSRGELLKTLVLSDLRPVGKSGKVRAYCNTMTNRKDVRSVITFEEIHIDEGDIDDRFFTKAYIERSR